MSHEPVSDTPVSDSPVPGLRATPLQALHHELGGRMVDFAGWELPIQYEGIVAEHSWCRSSAGLFDVSHMGVVELRSGAGQLPGAALERVTPAAVATLEPGRMRYGLLTTDAGGILDDFMVANLGDHLSMVINASRREVDVAHLRSRLHDLELSERSDIALLALQGPKAVGALARLQPAVADLHFLDVIRTVLDDTDVVVSRSGYTGEDGYELVVPAAAAERIARLLLAQPEVKPCGLGARDTLRLEAGLCLYGHDLDETTSPIEADLLWTVPKRRRDAGDFPGADRLRREMAEGPARVRVGLAAQGRRPVRDGTTLRSTSGRPAGTVTSGGFGPTLGRPVAMGYVAPDFAASGTELMAEVRGHSVTVTVSDLPFVPHRYRRPTV